MSARLRQDLRLLSAPPSPDGVERFLLHDPVAGRYHRLGRDEVSALSGEMPEELAQALARAKLLDRAMPSEALAREDRAARPSLGQLLVHKYLFFRIPLVRPERFLKAITPLFGFVFTRAFWIVTVLCGLAGLVLAGRQWEAFKATFLGFLTPEGMVGYALTLCVLKCLHELGHGVAATRYGVRVPVMGVAFLVMFPVLYTDTTEAWEVRERGKRVVIDAAGMLTEIAVACFAILAWSFLPEGPARSVAFFVATTSWTMSLLVNLNPCMRFDGYYLIGDALGVANLQQTGFGLGRWRMREGLFGWGEPKPALGDASGAGLERLLLAYAYGTWVYRFFLFIGIALLVHHLFPKAIGIVLFTVEILMFIGLPIIRELKVWGARRHEITATRRGRTTLAVGIAVLLAFGLPLSGRVAAPAFVTAEASHIVFPPTGAEVVAIHAASGDRVREGEVLVELVSVSLGQDIVEAELRLATAKAELDRARSARDAVSELDTRRAGVARAEAEVAALWAEARRLRVRAPTGGRVEMPEGLHVGAVVGPTEPLATLRTEGGKVEARVREVDAHRLRTSARLLVGHKRLAAEVVRIAPVAEPVLSEPALASVHGGPIVVDAGEDGKLLTRQPYVRVELALEGGEFPADGIGKVFIAAERESFAAKVWRRVVAVLVREGDF